MEAILIGTSVEDLGSIELTKILRARVLPRTTYSKFSPTDMRRAMPLPATLLRRIMEDVAAADMLEAGMSLFAISAILQFEAEHEGETEWLPAMGITGGGKVISVFGGDTSICYLLSDETATLLQAYLDSLHLEFESRYDKAFKTRIPEELTNISGITERIEGFLLDLAVFSVSELAEIDPETIAFPNIHPELVVHWVNEAKMMKDIPGLSGKGAEILVRGIGITTFAALLIHGPTITGSELRVAKTIVWLPCQFDLGRFRRLVRKAVL